jgi:hypothetical protein
MTEKQRKCQRGWEKPQGGGHQATIRVFHQTLKNKLQDIVEEPATIQVKEETAHSLRASDVGALVTVGSSARTDQKKMAICL